MIVPLSDRLGRQAGLPVDLENLFDRGWGRSLIAFKGFGCNRGDIEEADPACEEGGDGDFIGGVEHGRPGAARDQSGAGQARV